MIQIQAPAPFELARSPDAQHLARVISRFRLSLGFERAVRWFVRGVILGAATAIAISLGAWLADFNMPYWVVIAPILAALAIGLSRWPTRLEAARVGDSRLGLDERLATAVELTHRTMHGRFDALQLKDTVGTLQTMRPRLATRIDARELNGALALSVLALASLVLPNLPRPGFTTAATDPLALQALTDEDAQARSAIAELDPSQANEAQASTSLQTQAEAQDPDLANRVQAEQAERDALDRLSQALGKVSAGQPAADAIQRSDFGAARDLLSNLAEEADQLSDAAKQQLARSLQQAANATTTADRALADRERAAASALSKSSYAEQRQALRNLADQVERSGARSANADQLARDVGQLQQQQGAAPAQAAPQQSASQGKTGAQSSQGANGPASQPSAGQGPVADGGNVQGGTGDQGGAGAGNGPGGEPRGDQTNQLDSAGQSVDVPVKLGNGPGVRPTDGTEDQLGNDPTAGGRNVSELVQSQQTGQVAPEQNLVPGEQRPVVRGYFH